MLSLGWVADDCLVCPYHAWRFDASGACVRIPQSANAIIPAKARTPKYQCQERYGLIWACLSAEPPVYDLPEIPEFESGEWKVVNTGPFVWQSDASRDSSSVRANGRAYLRGTENCSTTALLR